MDLVLLPGMNCSPALWRGGRGPPPGDVAVHTPHLDGSDLDECVDRLLQDLPPVFGLAGLSLGGIVAMALVRRAPGRVAGLALLDTNPRPPTPEQRAGWRATIGRLEQGSTAEHVQEDLLPVLLGEASRADHGIVAATLTMAREVGEARLADQLRLQGTRVDERPGLRQVRVPTLVLCGDGDALCPVERHEEIASLVPGAELVVVLRSGHLTPLEQPDAVADQLTRWLGRL